MQIIISGHDVKFKAEHEENIRKDQLSSLTEKMKECIQKSVDLELNFEKVSKQKLVNEIKIFGIQGISEEELEHRISSNDIDSLFASEGVVVETVEAKRHLAEITDRHKEITKLVDNVTELTECFNEMRNLVEDQGVAVERAECAVDGAGADCERGVAALAAARSYRDKILEHKRRGLLLLATLLTLLMLVLIVALVTAAGGEEERGPRVDPSFDYDRPSVPYHRQTEYYVVEMEHVPCDPYVDPTCLG